MQRVIYQTLVQVVFMAFHGSWNTSFVSYNNWQHLAQRLARNELEEQHFMLACVLALSRENVCYTGTTHTLPYAAGISCAAVP